MDRIIYNYQPPHLYPLLTPTGAYKPAPQYPNIYPNTPTSPHLSSTPATAAQKARQSAAAATYNAYAAQAAAARAQVAAIQAARDEAAAVARLAMLQPKVTQASKGNPWSFVGGAYRMGEAATAPVQTPASVYRPAPVMTTPVYRPVPAPAPVYKPVSVPASVYRPAPPSAPAPASMGSNWTYNPNGYYFHR